MVQTVLGVPYICLTALFIPLLLQGVEILDPGQVVYHETKTDGVVGHGVILECGPTLPDVYIWGFTQPGTDTIRAVVYNFGKGPKVQKLASDLGNLTVISNSASLSIEKLLLAAEGVYTCQALYDTPGGARLYYYYVFLHVLVPVTNPYIVMSDSSPVEGTSMTMRCGLENGTGPINYIWEQESREGQLTTMAKIHDNNRFNVTEVNRNHTGWYRCIASNQVNQQRSDRVWLDIIFGPDQPQIDVTPYSVTERGYSTLEKETVSLLCQASSNPPSQYIWFYNNTQMYTGPQYTITKVLRMHTGNYACLAQNTYLNTRSRKTITLTVYYPPDGAPTCLILPVNNYTDLALRCTWEGGIPAATLRWSPYVFGEQSEGLTSITKIHKGVETANNTMFTCQGTHIASNEIKSCNARTWMPSGEPKCSAYATRNNEYLMLSCSWEGGFPRALVWWASSSGDTQGTSEENANILVLRSSAMYSGKAFICHAKHPLAIGTKQCTLKLEAPVLVTQRSVMTVYEGSDVQLTCILSRNYPVTEITWYNNLKQQVNEIPKKYVLERAAAWTNLTVRETDSYTDSGPYWCSASNAVGGAEIPIMLMVKRYPMPPNISISRIIYNSRQLTDVYLEWQLQTDGDLTGFFIEHQRIPEPVKKRNSDLPWQKLVDLEPDSRSYQINNLDPTGTYAFRITAINHRTIGNPSEIKILGVEILDPGQVVYHETKTDGVVGHGVILECGPTLPDVYIWGFTQPGTDTIRAVVYNFGKGPKVQKLASDLGNLTVISNSAALSIEKLLLAAEGVYTCQALYDTPDGARLYYYYVFLHVLVPVTNPYIVMSDSSPVEGTSMTMRCGLENGTGPINYIWEQESREGQLTTMAKIHDNNRFNVTEVNRNHTGWYRCIASNQVNQQRSDRVWLDIIFGPDQPQIDVTPYSVTERGYSALEKETVSLLCQASSNPPSQYVWFYNNTQMYTGPQYTITKVLRMHTGYYACLAQNTYLNTRSRKTITLTVYYPPDGAPTCLILPVNNHTDLALRCTWEGGIPAATLRWSPYVFGEQSEVLTSITKIQKGVETANNTMFTCQGTHIASNEIKSCNARTWMPSGEPKCSAYATRNNEYLMLSCSWEGGFPRALVWWASSSGDTQGTSEENANILVLRSSAMYSGKAFICHAKHPLAIGTKQCTLKLEAPVLVTQRSMMTVYEGSDVQLTCILSRNYPVTEITWYNNLKQHVNDIPKKYILERAAAWTNLTVRETDSYTDSGQYWCSATNAVGGAEIPIMLMVKRYPMPPNISISRIIYNSRQLTDVDMEWQLQTDGDLTGFFIERQRIPEPVKKRNSDLPWQKLVDLEPDSRSYQINNLDPTGTYAFRITAINHRTIGNPSEIKIPAEPPFNAYPAVIGAAIGGMIIATIITVLLFLYVVRNRNNNPRLHDLIFGRQNSQSRENINFPEDEVPGTAERDTGQPSPTTASMALPRPTATPTNLPPDEEPVNVTITVMASS